MIPCEERVWKLGSAPSRFHSVSPESNIDGDAATPFAGRISRVRELAHPMASAVGLSALGKGLNATRAGI